MAKTKQKKRKEGKNTMKTVKTAKKILKKTAPKDKTTPKPAPPPKRVKDPEKVIQGLRAQLSHAAKAHEDSYNELAATASRAHNDLCALRAYLGARYTAGGAKTLLSRIHNDGEGHAVHNAGKVGRMDRKADLLTIAANTSWKDQHFRDEERLTALRGDIKNFQTRVTQLQVEHSVMREDRDGAIREMNRLLKEHKKMEADRDGAISMLKTAQESLDTLQTSVGVVQARVVVILEDGILTAPFCLAPVPVQILFVDKDSAKVLPAKEVVDCAIYEDFADPISPHLYADHAWERASDAVLENPAVSSSEVSGPLLRAARERVGSHLEGVDTTAPEGEDDGEGEED